MAGKSSHISVISTRVVEEIRGDEKKVEEDEKNGNPRWIFSNHVKIVDQPQKRTRKKEKSVILDVTEKPKDDETIPELEPEEGIQRIHTCFIHSENLLDGPIRSTNYNYSEPDVSLRIAVILGAIGGSIMFAISAAPIGSVIILLGGNGKKVFHACMIPGFIVLPPAAGALGAAIVNRAMSESVSLKEATKLATVGNLVVLIGYIPSFMGNAAREKRHKQVLDRLDAVDRHTVEREVVDRTCH
ncbi:hypothetical protein BDQ17DRAFT_1466521 [Cyathus striatus]|nr:hypothetical protein BDQ17DRAFT_1466521 [Cyathus striatus]